MRKRGRESKEHGDKKNIRMMSGGKSKRRERILLRQKGRDKTGMRKEKEGRKKIRKRLADLISFVGTCLLFTVLRVLIKQACKF